MKKLISFMLFACMIVGLFTACKGNGNTPSSQGETSSETVTQSTQSGEDYSNLKIAMISDPIGNEQFILQAYNAIKNMADQYGFQWSSIECVDTAAWEENSRGVAAEGYDLLVAVGWQAAGPFSTLADEYPDTKFAVIDTLAENEKVKSINFNTAEGCYVLGAMIGTAFQDENFFGYVCNFQDQASYEYRYGFAEGVKSIIPEAQFMFNYANSYSDTSVVYELSMQQAAAGATFIFGGVSNSANTGIYQAALEQGEKGTPIYTTGLSVDQTTADNPYIIGGVTKQTDICMEMVLKEFLEGDFQGGKQTLGIREGAFGVVGVTTGGFNYRNQKIMTDEVIEAGKAALEDLIQGSVVIEVPSEAK